MSTPRSQTPLPPVAEPPRAVRRAVVVPPGSPERIAGALELLGRTAERCGVELVSGDAAASADLAVVLGGDGTMLRALQRFLGTPVACIGVNFGRIGFLTSIPADRMEEGLRTAFAGGYEVGLLPTIEGAEGGHTWLAVNDVVLTSATLGRMVMIGWSVDGEPLGELGCDGAIVATPTGSTAYNLSVGGPVLGWGVDGFVVSFVSPHSLRARPMVLGRPHLVELRNRSHDVPVQVIVDGHTRGRLEPGASVTVRMGPTHARLARLAGSSFFTRYREAFSE
ncbi:MAG TPA: NAD(+)/NADH kinase [Gaiellales bacterium]|nr:NAD(+)/NADH kinase [Gaiellales bacterium]